MTDQQPDNLILVYLRRIDANVAELRADNVEIKTRLGILEQQYASLSNVDRMEGRLSRIEARLDLIEPA